MDDKGFLKGKGERGPATQKDFGGQMGLLNEATAPYILGVLKRSSRNCLDPNQNPRHSTVKPLLAFFTNNDFDVAPLGKILIRFCLNH